MASPNGRLQADNILRDDAVKDSVPVHSFDPNASPSEKAAAAGKGRDQLQSVKQKASNEREVRMETPAESAETRIVPTITVQDHDQSKSQSQKNETQKSNGGLGSVSESGKTPGEDSKPQPAMLAKNTAQSVEQVQKEEGAGIPGAIPAGVAPAIPDWYRVGWRQVSGIDNAPLTEGEEKDKGVLDMFLSEQFYGTWYHNASLIIFAVFASHFLTRFNFGWGWLFILLAICTTYYKTSMERTRRNSRDDIQRELVKTRLASEHETADWMNHFLERFWRIYEPVLSATVVASVDQILSANTPAFLDSLRLTDFTLGTKAPRIDKVRTFPKTEEDIVMMDWGISFTPTDISDMTPRQAAEKINPKIVLSVGLGKGFATATMPILLENISLSGLLRIRMKLMSSFPHVQTVDVCFLEKPVIDYVLKPIGGEAFGFDIANIPGLSTFIRDMTHGTLGPMMYDPNVFTLNLEQMLSGKPLDAAIGVVQVIIHSARGIKGAKIGGGTPDPYISLSINNRAELAKTKYKTNTYNPTWMETKYLLINNLNESLVLSLYDYNDHRKNSLLSSASFELSKLLEDATQENLSSQLLKDGKERGELRYEVNYFPVIEPEEGNEDALNSTVGIVRLVVHQAKDLDSSKSMSSGGLNPRAAVFIGQERKAAYSTNILKRTNNPVWESAYEFICSNKSSGMIIVKVIDDRDFMKDPVVGYMSISLEDLLSTKGEAGRDWFPLSGCKSGRMRLSAEWKPLNMAGSLHGSEQYYPPIGVVRLLLDKATDVKNVEATLGGKSDPYVRVQVQNVTKGRTEVVNNNLNPVWDQIVYIPVHTLKETLTLECMDYQHLTRDRSLGYVELHVSDIAEESDDKAYPYKSKGVKTGADPIRLDSANSYKGHLHYTASFIPALALRGVKFEGQNQAQALSNSDENNDESGVVSDGGTVSSSDEEYQAVPDGVTFKGEKSNHKKSTSVDTTNTKASTAISAHTAQSSSEGTNGVEAANGVKEEEGVDMSTDELLKQQSGIIVFNVISGQLPKKARLEVLLDDGYWPCFSTLKSRSSNARWDYVGEGFVKEIDFGQVWLRLNEADEGEKDDIIAEWKVDTKQFLQGALAGPQTYTLFDQEKPTSKVKIEARYVPVPVKLEPRETINNQGKLRVDLLDGQEIHGVDRGGKSDPYAVFSLNGQKVFKSQTKKKTVAPDWNENFEIQIPSRVAANFEVEIFDWNQIEQAKSLGVAKINVADIEPFLAAEQVLKLVSSKHGEKGQVRIRMLFQPEIIAKARKNTSTFSTAGRAMTQLGGLPVSAGKGVLSGVAGVFKLGSREHGPVEDQSEIPAGQASQSVAVSDNLETSSTAFPSSDNGHASTNGPGTLRVTVLQAKDLSQQDIKPYATVRLGDKEFKTKHTHKTAMPEWNETFNFAASSLTPKLFIWIHDHKTLGKDKVLGEAEVDIWRHIQPHGTSAANVSVEMHLGGLLHLRLEFDANANPRPRTVSASSSAENPLTKTVSMVSPSRFSLRGRRPGAEANE